MIEIREISNPDELKDMQLRQRALRSRKKNSRQLVALAAQSEAGYASVDLRLEIDCGVIYELFVLPAHRRIRIGTQLVLAAETIIKQSRCSRSIVAAQPLDSATDRSILLKWYEGMGYGTVDGMEEHEKWLK